MPGLLASVAAVTTLAVESFGPRSLFCNRLL